MTIEVINLRKRYPAEKGFHQVLNGVSLTLKKGDKVAILGRNGAGKSTLIRIIGGIEVADSGIINSSMSISWPLGFDTGMQGSLTGRDNILFLSRIYNRNPKMVFDYVADFTELGKFLQEPVKNYSSGMRGRLNFALSMAFSFDCILIDEGLSAGDSRFTDKCKLALQDKSDCSIIMVSHSKDAILEFCEKAYVLQHGRLTSFESIEEAYYFYE